MMFRGDSLKSLYCCLKKDFQAPQENALALLKPLLNWITVDFVLLDPMSRDLYEEGGRMAKEMLINDECLWKPERNFLGQGMKTAWVPWVVRVTYRPTQSGKPANLRTLPLFATGQDPEHRLFVDPDMSPSLLAVQAHVHWAEQLVEHLGGTCSGLDETSGTDPKHTKIYFKDPTPCDVNELVDKFGSPPRFALMTSAMYEGRVIDEFPHVFNVYTTSARRSEVGPYMFAFLLSALWNDW